MFGDPTRISLEHSRSLWSSSNTINHGDGHVKMTRENGTTIRSCSSMNGEEVSSFLLMPSKRETSLILNGSLQEPTHWETPYLSYISKLIEFREKMILENPVDSK